MVTRIKDKRKRVCARALVRKIRQSPDPILKKRCKVVKDVTKVNEKVIHMIQVLMATPNGVGIAANQVGFKDRIIAVRPAKHNVIVMINPRIKWKSKEKYGQYESCLSYPGSHKKIDRHMAIRLTYQDRDGVQQTMECTFWMARIIQHEVDHLNGKCKLA
jgi:peptide deformylase